MTDYTASVRLSRGGDRIQVKLTRGEANEVFFKRNVAIEDKKAINQLKIDLKDKGLEF